MASLTKLVARSLSALPGGRRLLQAAAGGSGSGAPIFMLHRVLPDPGQCYDPEMVVSLAAFEAFLGWAVTRYEVVPLDDLHGRLRRRRGDPGAKPLCALTFDDGWLDTFTHAFPALQRWRVPATVFLPLHFIGSARRFWQERLYFHLRRLAAESDALGRLREVARGFAWCPALEAGDLNFVRLRAQLVRRSSPEAEAFVDRLGTEAGLSLELAGRVFMNWDEVRVMHQAGVRFGSHTLDHTLLRCAPPAAAALELRRSRQALSAQIEGEVQSLSYPWGGMSAFTGAQARTAGYGCAVTTRRGLARADSNPWRLPRIALSDPQLGWPSQAHAPEPAAPHHFSPATVQVHLARARALRHPAGLKVQLSDNPGARLRIGFLVDNPQSWADQPQEHLGGSELQLRHLIEALDPEYFDIELYFLHRPEAGLPTRLPWLCFAGAPTRAGRLATIAGMRTLLRQRRPAVVQSMFQDGTFLGVPAAWLAGAPSILCARRNAGYWKHWYHRAALRVINRMANAWQTNASGLARMLSSEERVPPQAIEIVPNWLDLDRFQPADPALRDAARLQIGLPPQAFIAVSVANLWPVKRLDTFVAAAATVCRQRPEGRFILLGEGPEQAALEAQIVALGLGAQVQLAGSSDAVEVYLAAADAAVLTSRSEGCSNAVLEYMAAGLPTVLSDIPANRALSSEGLFPVGDPEALAAVLLALASDPDLRARRGAANRAQAEQYGGAAFADRVQGHYLRVAGLAQRRWRHPLPPSARPERSSL